jgi:hypothetical protein
MSSAPKLLPTATLALIIGGCAPDSLTLPSLPTVASLPSLPATLGAETSRTALSTDAPVDVYARIARGALKCWFGVAGSLKATHTFHARVEPPTSGGAAEIIVHTRDASQQAQGALKAFRITITPAATGSVIETESLRFPVQQGAAMTADVSRWIGGEEGCSVVGTGGWEARTPAATKADTTARAGPKAKAAKQ